MSSMKYKVVLKGHNTMFDAPSQPEIFETLCWTREDAIKDFCSRRGIFNKSEILEFIPLVISKDGPGTYGEGFRTQGAYYDKPNSAFKAQTVHPRKLINSQWRVNNNRYADYIYKITDVICHTTGLIDQYNAKEWEVEYAEINPITKQIVRAGAFDMIEPTYKHMNLAEFMKRYYCIFLAP